jgi:hypothetical protein
MGDQQLHTGSRKYPFVYNLAVLRNFFWPYTTSFYVLTVWTNNVLFYQNTRRHIPEGRKVLEPVIPFIRSTSHDITVGELCIGFHYRTMAAEMVYRR